MIQPDIRDDNLRLIFADVQTRILDERLRAIRAGFMLLGIFVTATVLFSLGMVAGEPLIVGAFGFAIAIAWVLAVGTSLLSPLIAVMLVLERHRTKREIAEHRAFLASYGRSPDGSPNTASPIRAPSLSVHFIKLEKAP